MARSAQAPVAQSNIKWHEATFEVDEKSVRVQYLSDRELNNSQIADLVARGQNYGRAWIDDRAQGSAARIEKAAEMVREAGAPTGHERTFNASAEQIERFAGRRTVEAAGSAARQVGEWAIETGERVISAIVPVRVERQGSAETAGATRGRRRTTVVAETAMGDEAEVQSAAVQVETPQPEATRAEEKPGEAGKPKTVLTVPHHVMIGSTANVYQFEIDYDPLAIHGDHRGSETFFDRPENRNAVSRFRYREQSPNGEWGEWKPWNYENQSREEGSVGKLHTALSKTIHPPATFYVSEEGKTGLEERFNIYIDREKAEQLGVGIPDFTRMTSEAIIAKLRELQNLGLVSRASSGSPDLRAARLPGERSSERPWLRMDVNDHMDFLENKYGAKLRISVTRP